MLQQELLQIAEQLQSFDSLMKDRIKSLNDRYCGELVVYPHGKKFKGRKAIVRYFSLCDMQLYVILGILNKKTWGDRLLA